MAAEQAGLLGIPQTRFLLPGADLQAGRGEVSEGIPAGPAFRGRIPPGAAAPVPGIGAGSGPGRFKR